MNPPGLLITLISEITIAPGIRTLVSQKRFVRSVIPKSSPTTISMLVNMSSEDIVSLNDWYWNLPTMANATEASKTNEEVLTAKSFDFLLHWLGFVKNKATATNTGTSNQSKWASNIVDSLIRICPIKSFNFINELYQHVKISGSIMVFQKMHKQKNPPKRFSVLICVSSFNQGRIGREARMFLLRL